MIPKRSQDRHHCAGTFDDESYMGSHPTLDPSGIGQVYPPSVIPNRTRTLVACNRAGGKHDLN